MAAMENFYTARQVADLLQVKPRTVFGWIKQGVLPATRVGPRSLRIDPADVERLVAPARPAEVQPQSYDVPLPIQLANGSYIESARRDYHEGNSL